MAVYGVLLAAGRGRRMGAAKHLIQVPGPDGPETLLQRTLRALRAAPLDGVAVVLHAGDALGARLAAAAGARVVHARAGEGRAASVRAGVLAAPDAPGWLFVLCDQPLLRAEDFGALCARFERDPTRIVCARYAGERGSPTLFPAHLRSELLALRGREGGRVLLARHVDALAYADLEPERGRDLDVPADLRALFGVDLPRRRATMRPAMERTLSIIKPDAVAAGHTGSILQALEAAGLRIRALRMLQLTPEQAAEFYAVHRERPFFKSLCEFMISGPIVVAALEGEDAVARYRTLMGATNPAQAEEGTLRKRFATDIERNAVHGSDAPETARTELHFFFPEL